MIPQPKRRQTKYGYTQSGLRVYTTVDSLQKSKYGGDDLKVHALQTTPTFGAFSIVVRDCQRSVLDRSPLHI